MEKFTEDKTGSFYSYLSEGCRLCQEGAKMVLFVTGLCPKNCFYCPLSDKRRGKDLVFANERLISSDEDLLKEAELMDALGTGITGGEPLLKLERVLHYIRMLKASFGIEHHIHLYTSLAPGRQVLEKLADAGLDEIRFHPPQECWNDLKNSQYANSLQNAKELGIEAGIEIPALEDAEKVSAFAEEMGVFLNLNELEFSDNNSEALLKNGFCFNPTHPVRLPDPVNLPGLPLRNVKRPIFVPQYIRMQSSSAKDFSESQRILQESLTKSLKTVHWYTE
ncbi:radical SAM protein [Methanosarcina barkeri]|uniref:radical SAM protein n=1 Tax=Methanosarcina barkeri TaxID=2208 RepID=UPI000AC33586|nr:radical SAM protein [Methanosarcina barkeri]